MLVYEFTHQYTTWFILNKYNLRIYTIFQVIRNWKSIIWKLFMKVYLSDAQIVDYGLMK